MAGSGKVASNPGEFVACAGLEFPPPSKLMVAQRFPKMVTCESIQHVAITSLSGRLTLFSEATECASFYSSALSEGEFIVPPVLKCA